RARFHYCSTQHAVRITSLLSLFFFFNQPATIDLYTLSLHDALPISRLITIDYPRRRTTPRVRSFTMTNAHEFLEWFQNATEKLEDRKSTRLNSSHVSISYAVFCLKKKKK